jgi:5-methyltetrahydrofolate--homocysteine methyltransferase
MQPILDRLSSGVPVLGDGAWGTQLMPRGLAIGGCPESFNLDAAEVLAEIAGRYLEAGAEVITTNTFGGSAVKLAHYGLADRTEEVNRAGVAAIRGVCAGKAWISGSVGPSGAILKPYGDAEPAALLRGFERQVQGLAEGGVDLLCIETMTDLAEAKLAVTAARTVAPELPVVATMTFDPTPRGFFTIMGVSIAQAIAGLRDAGADVVGANCGSGIDVMVEIAAELTSGSTLPVAIQANAGLPQRQGPLVVWPDTPEQMATGARRLADLGVALIGGCCGTGPEHIRAMRAALD